MNLTAFAQEGSPRGDLQPGAPVTLDSQYSIDTAKDGRAPRRPTGATNAAGQPLVSVFIKLAVAPVSSYSGDVAGLPATKPDLTGRPSLDLAAPESVQYRDYVRQEIGSFEQALQRTVPGAEIKYRYDVILGGVAALVPVSELAQLESLPGVVAVYPDTLLHLDTDASPAFIGAAGSGGAWQQLGGQESAGEGVVVGVLDTGVWPEHPSFSDPDPSGKPYAPPPASWHGTACEFGSAVPGDAPFPCNNKLIGAERFMDTYDAFGPGLLPGEFLSARDDGGHGTHTASTAAGNAGVAASIFGVPRGVVSGIAPRAKVAAYKVCGDGGCYSTDSAAAIQQAILDGVNVINFSISGGNTPYSDTAELAFLDAYNAGVFVATSAGNSGPAPDTTAHRGPWVMTVAASTHDRQFVNTVTFSSGADSVTVKGVSVTDGISTPHDIYIPTDDPICEGPFDPGSLDGKIVICKRGVTGRVAKGIAVMEGGAVGMVLYNAIQQDQETDNHFLPTSHINADQAAIMFAFIDSHTGVQATMTAGVAEHNPDYGDIVAGFSSRGGPAQTLGVSKPDITAPGVQILAGNTPMSVDPATGPQGELFQAIAGTSMSSPHIAGSGALMKALHPNWTPGQIKSALMTSALGGVVKEDEVTPADPFDVGSGRVDLSKSGKVGLTFDETGANYLALEDKLWEANYPSLFFPVMPGIMTVKRTVHNETNSRATWRLTVDAPADVKVSVPSSVTVPARGNASFYITVDASTVPLGEVRFATLYLKNGGQWLHFPISLVRQQPEITVEKTCDPTTLPKGDKTGCVITATNTTFDEANVLLIDRLPPQLRADWRSVRGGFALGSSLVVGAAKLAGATPPDISVTEDPGYAGVAPLGNYGIAPLAGVTDESISNFNVPAFIYGGQTYTKIGLVSNGYAVVGGGTTADVDYINHPLPDAALPNNVLAPFWTDLNPDAGGTVSIGILGGGGLSWLILEWNGVPEWGSGLKVMTQIWIGLNGEQDISFSYGLVEGNGDGGFLTVGAENIFGNRGGMLYFDGEGTLPTPDTGVVVTAIPGEPGESHVLSFNATGYRYGPWTNCVYMASDKIAGTNAACVSGEVVRGANTPADDAEREAPYNLFMPFVSSR